MPTDADHSEAIYRCSVALLVPFVPFPFCLFPSVPVDVDLVVQKESAHMIDEKLRVDRNSKENFDPVPLRHETVQYRVPLRF